jgi:hypothetical protein
MPALPAQDAQAAIAAPVTDQVYLTAILLSCRQVDFAIISAIRKSHAETD